MPRLLSVSHTWMLIAVVFTGLIMSIGQSAQTQPPAPATFPSYLPYGEPISLDLAKHLIAAGQVEAKKNNWPVAIAIVDPSGFLVAFERMENTQLGSVEVSQEKAKTAALFRRPSKSFEETLAQGGVNLKLLKLPGALPIEGGVPIVVNGKIVGAIGVSGVKSSEDGQIAAAALEALKPNPPRGA